MTPERLEELRRQRALVQQHLNWLDQEISENQVTETSAPAAPVSDSPESSPKVEASDLAEISHYTPDPQSAGQDARKGCLMLFLLIIAVMALILCGIYFWKYRDRPLFLPSSDSAQVSTYFTAS